MRRVLDRWRTALHAPANNEMQLTKRMILQDGVQDGPVVIESRFAADLGVGLTTQFIRPR